MKFCNNFSELVLFILFVSALLLPYILAWIIIK